MVETVRKSPKNTSFPVGKIWKNHRGTSPSCTGRLGAAAAMRPRTSRAALACWGWRHGPTFDQQTMGRKPEKHGGSTDIRMVVVPIKFVVLPT